MAYQLGIRAETIKKVLSGLAIDFIDGQAEERVVYLYDEDVNIAGSEYPLPSNKAIKVTFEYADVIPPAIDPGIADLDDAMSEPDHVWTGAEKLTVE